MEDHRRRRHNGYNCEQCDNWYESREDLEDHRRRRHNCYNCEQYDNWYESKEDLKDHKRRRHDVCWNEKEQLEEIMPCEMHGARKGKESHGVSLKLATEIERARKGT